MEESEEELPGKLGKWLCGYRNRCSPESAR